MHGLAAAHAHGYLPANCTFKLLHLCFTDKPWCVSDPRSGTVGSCWRQASAMGDGRIPDAIAMGSRSSCPFRTAAKKRQVGMMKVSDEAWREMRILYSHVAEGPLSGKISLKCTLGQPIMAK